VSIIIRRYTDRMKFYCFFHILLVLFCIIVYMVVCFVCFYFILYIMYSYCYVYSVLCIVSLWCSMYRLCVNVYCTTATGCQPNYSDQIYHIISYHIISYHITRVHNFRSLTTESHSHEFRINRAKYFWPAAGPKLNGTPPPCADCTCCNKHGAERS
jgi:hypothetical protein